MKRRKHTPIGLNGLFMLVLTVCLMDLFSSFKIKSQAVKSFSYVGLLVLLPVLLVWPKVSKEVNEAGFWSS
ncbi:hypothetical protein CA264_00140 [Pontibacter actiniarum]|uniref:Uncharacterized protein n=1 Tax=Pontibacter actiniarum TaxID=323450 RepID=A0A1X9YM97_9BACT|nr:hypothetical protein CA264_00140 [Pontibacter actiniarum]